MGLHCIKILSTLYDLHIIFIYSISNKNNFETVYVYEHTNIYTKARKKPGMINIKLLVSYLPMGEGTFKFYVRSFNIT